jgi:hypothetical protein
MFTHPISRIGYWGLGLWVSIWVFYKVFPPFYWLLMFGIPPFLLMGGVALVFFGVVLRWVEHWSQPAERDD